ncbi:hypothetical protein [Streptodolium elevatio]|uniref:Uncharacterized protein n=1 Tax=Streptodolium elevatio TaxID=3157996 RepID=A0ABV3DM89_9ACTN
MELMDELGNLIGQAGVWHVVVVLVALWALEMRASVRAARKRSRRPKPGPMPIPRHLSAPTSARLTAAGARKSAARGH